MTDLRAQNAGGRRQRQSREEPPRQARSPRHGSRSHRGPVQGSDPDRLFEGSGGGAEGRLRFRQGQRQARHSRRRDGQDRPQRRRRQGACRAAVARRTARQAGRHDRRRRQPGSPRSSTRRRRKLARVIGAYAKKNEAA